MSILLERLSPLDLLTACIWAEARGEILEGQVAVCNVVLNRAVRRTIKEVILQPAQFSWTNEKDPNYGAVIAQIQGRSAEQSLWHTAAVIAALGIARALVDLTHGATHYLNIELTRQLRGGGLPNWVDLTKVTVKIGNHTFLKL